MPARKPKTKKAKRAAMRQTMHEYKEGTLHSGSKTGPKVKDKKQAIAIGLEGTVINGRDIEVSSAE